MSADELLKGDENGDHNGRWRNDGSSGRLYPKLFKQSSPHTITLG